MELEVPGVEDMVNDGVGVQANLPEIWGRWVSGCRALGFGCWCWALGFRFWCFLTVGFRALGFGLRVYISRLEDLTLF